MVSETHEPLGLLVSLLACQPDSVDANTQDSEGGPTSLSATSSPKSSADPTAGHQHHQGSGVMLGGTYRVTADRPIIAYQFSPFTQVSATSDASMLD